MITIEHILSKISSIDFIGKRDEIIHQVIPFDSNNTRTDILTWCNDKNISAAKELKAGTLICSDKLDRASLHKNTNYIIVSNPRRVFQQVLTLFFDKTSQEAGISATAIIHPSTKIGSNVSIGHYTVIEEGCVIGNDTVIGYHNAIHRNTQIGNSVKIGSNNTIGGVGFGYEKDEDGQYNVLPHIGNVIIRDHAEIGNNNTIDRAVLSSTIIGENVKVDNLIHIAHNVEIGRNSLIIANAMIGGSTIIGENTWVAPSSSLLNKIVVNDNAVIGMGAVVIRNVSEGETVIGNPAKPLTKRVD